jgi:hypothetical protein
MGNSVKSSRIYQRDRVTVSSRQTSIVRKTIHRTQTGVFGVSVRFVQSFDTGECANVLAPTKLPRNKIIPCHFSLSLSLFFFLYSREFGNLASEK